MAHDYDFLRTYKCRKQCRSHSCSSASYHHQTVPAASITPSARSTSTTPSSRQQVIVNNSMRDKAPYTWRIDGGYIISPASPPTAPRSDARTVPPPKPEAPIHPRAQELKTVSSPGMVCVETGSQRICFQPPPPYLNVRYYSHQLPPGYVLQPPPPMPPGVRYVCFPEPPPPKAASKPEKHAATTGKDGKDEKAENDFKPPSIAPGTNYMFHREHTQLHIFSKATQVWDKKYHGQTLDFKVFKVATNFSVKNVIERIVAKETDKSEWAATEMIEQGEGAWLKGATIEYATDKAKSTLESLGWGPKRGKELPPVWLCVHKIKKKDGCGCK